MVRGARAQEGRAVVIGCGCGSKTATGGKFVHIATDGKETVKRTEVEVRAMVIRQGGTWVKR